MEFVRTKYGIFKVVKIGHDDGYRKDVNLITLDRGIPELSYNREFYADELILKNAKLSDKPIDLIEIGDYVNGFRVEDVYRPEGTYVHWIKLSCNPIDNWKNEDIKSIVTKEQFEREMYAIDGN